MQKIIQTFGTCNIQNITLDIIRGSKSGFWKIWGETGLKQVVGVTVTLIKLGKITLFLVLVIIPVNQGSTVKISRGSTASR